MKTAEIREATKEDLHYILEIRNDVIQTTTAIYEDTKWAPEQLVQWYDARIHHGFPVYVAELDGNVVGYCSFGTFRSGTSYKPTVEIAVHVHKDARGRGIGTMMLEFLIHEAKERGYHSMVAAIDAANTQSIDLHKKQGFEVVGTMPQVARKFDRWLDLCLMQKLLN